jgi:hypothetical protein
MQRTVPLSAMDQLNSTYTVFLERIRYLYYVFINNWAAARTYVTVRNQIQPGMSNAAPIRIQLPRCPIWDLTQSARGGTRHIERSRSMVVRVCGLSGVTPVVTDGTK